MSQNIDKVNSAVNYSQKLPRNNSWALSASRARDLQKKAFWKKSGGFMSGEQLEGGTTMTRDLSGLRAAEHPVKQAGNVGRPSVEWFRSRLLSDLF